MRTKCGLCGGKHSGYSRLNRAKTCLAYKLKYPRCEGNSHVWELCHANHGLKTEGSSTTGKAIATNTPKREGHKIQERQESTG